MSSLKNLYILPLIICLFVLGSCSNEDYLGGHYTAEGSGTLMHVTAQINAQSNPTLVWSEGDVIGIAAGYGLYDATARNREYKCQADGKTFSCTTEYPMYVKGTTQIVAYYPFVGMDGAEPALSLNTKNQTDITDYLVAKSDVVTRETGDHVNLVFDYMLARLQMTITAPAGETIKSYRLSGFAQQAQVDPYTLDLTLDNPEDLVGTGDDIKTITLKLIPQTVDTNSGVPAQLVLVGTSRSYTIDFSDIDLQAGSVQSAVIDVTDGIGTIEFLPSGATWTDSGIGGEVSSN